MSSELKEFKVTIFGQEYTLVSDETEAVVLQAAQSVDRSMSELSKRAPSLDAIKLAVLTAVRLARQHEKLIAEQATQNRRCSDMVERIDHLLSNSLI